MTVHDARLQVYPHITIRCINPIYGNEHATRQTRKHQHNVLQYTQKNDNIRTMPMSHAYQYTHTYAYTHVETHTGIYKQTHTHMRT